MNKAPNVSIASASAGAPRFATDPTKSPGSAQNQQNQPNQQVPGKVLDWVKKGVDIWTIVRKAQADRRAELAKIFKDNAKWKSWDEIVAVKSDE